MKVLVVDDEEIVREGLKKQLIHFYGDSALVEVAESANIAMNFIQMWTPDIVMTDIEMPEMNGIELIRHAKNLGSSASFIIVSGYSEFEYARNAIKLGAADYLVKPIDEDDLVQCINNLPVSHTDEREAFKAKHENDNYSGTVRKMIAYVEQNLTKPISIRDVAEYVGKSENYLSIIFKKETGFNFNKYVTDAKMDYAKHLASSGEDIKVYELADKVGYTDVKYFTRVFKEHFGTTPGKLIND